MARGKKRKTRSDKGKPRKRARKSNSIASLSGNDDLLLERLLAKEKAKEYSRSLAKQEQKIDEEESLIGLKPWERAAVKERRELNKMKAEIDAKKALANPDFNPASLALLKSTDPAAYADRLAKRAQIESSVAKASAVGLPKFSTKLSDTGDYETTITPYDLNADIQFIKKQQGLAWTPEKIDAMKQVMQNIKKEKQGKQGKDSDLPDLPDIDKSVSKKFFLSLYT